MRPEIRLTPPLLARRRIAGFVMPWMLSLRTLRCLLAPPLPNPFPPFPRPDIFDKLSFEEFNCVRLLRMNWNRRRLSIFDSLTVLMLDNFLTFFKFEKEKVKIKTENVRNYGSNFQTSTLTVGALQTPP